MTKNNLITILFFCFGCSFAQQPFFGNEIHVKINGLTFDAMEPAISADGNALFFNSLNDGMTTSLYYASKVDDSTFNFIGLVPIVNQTITPRLDGVPSLDSSNNFYWVSTRNYPTYFENLHRIRFLSNGYTNFGRVYGDFYIYSPGWLIMDASINYNGSKLIYCNAHFNNCANSLPCKASMGIATKINDSTFNKDPNSNLVMATINDTTNYIVYAPHLTKDGLELYYTRLLKNSTQTEIMVATRSTTSSAFGQPSLLIGSPYIAPEAPALTTDKNSMYYHRKNGNKHEIYLRYRTTITSVTENNRTADFVTFPNPTNGLFQIKTNDLVNVIVYNNQGGVVLETNFTSINLSDFSDGLYFIKISNQKTSQTIKLIKN